MGKNVLVLGLTLLVLFGAVSSASTSTSPAKIINGIFSNAVSFFMKWLWSLKSTTKTAISGRPMMKFESGYTVETVFDGSKLGIEPYSVEVLPGGELLVLDSANSNRYRISASLSLCFDEMKEKLSQFKEMEQRMARMLQQMQHISSQCNQDVPLAQQSPALQKSSAASYQPSSL